MKKRTVYLTALVLAVSLACMTGCGRSTGTDQRPAAEEAVPETGGVLYLSVNPEIAVFYDTKGNVMKVEGCNDDGSAILEGYTGYEGKAADQVVRELVTVIGEAGYLAKEAEGESRKITIEIETGSVLPDDAFLEEVVSEVRACVSEHEWDSYVDVEGGSDYGITDFIPDRGGTAGNEDADSGKEAERKDVVPAPDHAGATDYGDTDYGPNGGITDYSHTDYGPNSDGVTDYNDTDYGPNSDGITDYGDTDYGPNSDGVTDYNDTDYGPNSDGVTDYDSSDYHHTDYHASDYSHTDYHHSDYNDSDYNASDYDT